MNTTLNCHRQRHCLTSRCTQGIAGSALAAVLMGTNPASAATATTTFNVTATVVASCSTSASDMAFGTYNPNAVTDKTGTSTISVNCSLGTPYTVSLNSGMNVSSGARRMADGASFLTYEVYQDIAATLVFGSVADLLGVSGIGTGLSVPSTIYGVIPKAQNVSPGSYTDQITVTVDY